MNTGIFINGEIKKYIHEKKNCTYTEDNKMVIIINISVDFLNQEKIFTEKKERQKIYV